MLKKFRSMNAMEVHDTSSGNGALVSYSTPVAVMENGRLILGYDFDCSVTTMSHVRAWLSDAFGIRTSIPQLRRLIDLGEVEKAPVGWDDVFSAKRRCGR